MTGFAISGNEPSVSATAGIVLIHESVPNILITFIHINGGPGSYLMKSYGK
jgi:hypothetical protein